MKKPRIIPLRLKQSSGVWLEKFSYIVQIFGLKCNEVDNLVFYCHTSLRKYIDLIEYVDDIVIKGNDVTKNYSSKATFEQTLFSNQRCWGVSNTS